MRGINIMSTDPAYNLALEELLLTKLQTHEQGYFLLWHNTPSIIVGRHQNTHQEINTALVARYSLPVVRRMTGGGAVYHDLGNLNFSFLRPLKKDEGPTDFSIFLRPIQEALNTLGVQITFSGRNDLLCQGRKISGSAQWRRQGKILHHGTLLVSLDMDMLAAVLTGAPDKYLSKGIQSLRSRVANLEEFLPSHITMDDIKQSLLHYCAHETHTLDTQILQEAESLAEQKYRSHAWNYAASPPFSELRRQRFAWGLVECHFTVCKGYIQQCKIFGDFFSEANVEDVEKALCHIPYTATAVEKALHTLPLEKYFLACDTQVMYKFFCNFSAEG